MSQQLGATVGEQQLKILECFWYSENGMLTGPEVIDSMRNRFGEKQTKSAINTMLKILVNKGYLTLLSRQSHAYLYQVLITKEDFNRQEMMRLRDRLFKGSSSAMITCFLNTDIDETELREVKKLIEGSN